MKRKFNYLLILPLLALFASCSRDVFDEYYGRPDYLEDPIYQQLDARGNFKNFTALIEKAGYKDILSKSGYWTMFAPNDAAFAKYFQENGISDVSKIDDATASKIVRYALVYNAFREDQLSDYQSSQGWVEGNAFRRRTAYYDGFINKTIDGQPKVIVASNRNGSNNYISGDNNNKYITYFADEYFTTLGLTAADYNFFYPNVSYTKFNVLGGSVKEADIIAENGIIHEVDNVSLPPVNIDQYLEQNSAPNTNKFNLFHDLIEKYLVTYVFNQNATNTYRNFSGKSDDVYVKTYDPLLSFAPNNENYVKEMDNDGQSDAYTLIAPDDNSFKKFRDDILLKHYASLDKLPKYIFEDFINAHMVQHALWPSQVSSFENALGEDIRFDFNTDITDRKVLSNGFFYGANKVQKSNLFYSVYTSAYLDPDYSLATRLYRDGSGIKEMISNIKNRYVLFLPSDQLLTSLGYRYDANYLRWVYTNPATGVSDSNAAYARLYRILYNSIVATPNGELDNIMTTSGIIRSGDIDFPGEYIKWDHGKLYSAGNEAMNNVVNIIGSPDVQQNGVTYYIDNLLEFTDRPKGLEIKELAEAPNSQFSSFFNYLKNSTIYNAATGDIQGVVLGTSYTFIIPSNAAITQAVLDGVLPGNSATGVPNFTPSEEGQKGQVIDFINYHILINKTVSDDGLETGQVETLLKDNLGDKTYVLVESSKSPRTLSFTAVGDGVAREADYIQAQSNNLADRSLIHLVDNYLTLPKIQ